MKAISSSKTSVSLYPITRRSIPEDCYHHSRRRENLASRQVSVFRC
jgi:hypothetical protein